jgi:hypothetical protein
VSIRNERIRTQATQYDWLTLEPLPFRDWLVTDEGQRQLTGDGVIGHIQLFHGRYETLHLSAPLEREFYDSLESAVDSFAPHFAAIITAPSAASA